MKGSPNLKKDEIPIQDEEIATHQEAVPLPWFAGARKISGRWISEATDRITKAVAQTGKKGAKGK